MDPLDAFYQQLDSEALLKRHMQDLVDDAVNILGQDPSARVAGLITLPDSRDAEPLRTALTAMSGQPVPAGLLVGVVPRAMVEQVLVANVGTDPWREDPGQPQRVLPVVVSTRDGFRFGFARLDRSTSGDANESP